MEQEVEVRVRMKGDKTEWRDMQPALILTACVNPTGLIIIQGATPEVGLTDGVKKFAKLAYPKAVEVAWNFTGAWAMSTSWL